MNIPLLTRIISWGSPDSIVAVLVAHRAQALQAVVKVFVQVCVLAPVTAAAPFVTRAGGAPGVNVAEAALEGWIGKSKGTGDCDRSVISVCLRQHKLY